MAGCGGLFWEAILFIGAMGCIFFTGVEVDAAPARGRVAGVTPDGWFSAEKRLLFLLRADGFFEGLFGVVLFL